MPDSTTIWLFRERLAETGRDLEVWGELQRQLDAKGLGGVEKLRRTPRSLRRIRARAASPAGMTL